MSYFLNIIFFCSMDQIVLNTINWSNWLINQAVSNDPEASRSRRTKLEKRQQELKQLVENYENLSTVKYMGYLVDFYNHTLDFVWYDSTTKVLTIVLVHWLIICSIIKIQNENPLGFYNWMSPSRVCLLLGLSPLWFVSSCVCPL